MARFISLTLLVVICVAWSAARAADAEPTTTIDLKLIELKDQSGMYGYGLDPKGEAKIQYENQAGYLLLRHQNGKLAIDTNGDGKLDEKDVAPFVPRNTMVQVATKIGQRMVEMPMLIASVQGEGEDRYVMLNPRGALEGQFGEYRITLLAHLSGRIAQEYTNVAISGAKRTVGGPWSPTMAIGDDLYEVALVEDGQKLSLKRYTGEIATAKVALADETLGCNVALQSDKQYARFGGAETAKLVPGDYRLDSVMLSRKSGNEISWFSGQHERDKKPLSLKTGENTIKVGPPLMMDFTATRNGEMIEISDVKISGAGGETYRPSVREPKETFAAFIKLGEKEEKLCKLGFG